jgi:hypothetical protein
MQDSLEEFALAAMPEIPEPGKWTKTAPSLKSLVIGSVTNKYLSPSFEIAFAAMTFKTKKEPVTADDDSTVDPKLQHDLEWHQVMLS